MATTEESRVIGKHTYHVGDQVIYTYSSPGKRWNNEKILTVEKFTPKRMKLTGGAQVDIEGNIYDSKAYSGDIKPYTEALKAYDEWEKSVKEAESEIDAAFEPWQRQSWVRGKISNNLTERMETAHKLHQELTALMKIYGEYTNLPS